MTMNETDGRRRIGAAIKQRRQALGLSLAEVARQLGIALSTVSKIENGKISSSFERLDALSRVLNADLVELIEDRPVFKEVAQTARPAAIGTRRSVTRSEGGVFVDASPYRHLFHSTDLLHKQFQPLVSDILVEKIEDYGPLTHHPGEEFNFVLEGELEFHSEVYAPIRLKVGDSIYFDAEMGHAHVRVGRALCRVLAIVSPRSHSADHNAHPEIHRIVSGEGTYSTPITRANRQRRA